jgi:hypothetical protein
MNRRYLTVCCCALGLCLLGTDVLPAQERLVGGQLSTYGDIDWLRQRLEKYDVILKPDKDIAEWWAGAPSVVRDDDGVFWLAARMRSPEKPKGERGYEIRILRSDDGVRFERVHRIRREDVPLPGFERPALLQDHKTKKFKLYLCALRGNGGWTIFKLDDVRTPQEFVGATAKPVIGAGLVSGVTGPVTGYKDPVIIFTHGRYHCYVIGYLWHREHVFYFISDDGELWRPGNEGGLPLMNTTGWHDYFVRPSSVIPLGLGYLFVYEGSSMLWLDPTYNIATGIAFTLDLRTITDLTPTRPLFTSTTPGDYHTWRYSHWLKVDHELWIYAEVATPHGTNEIRLFKLPIS